MEVGPLARLMVAYKKGTNGLVKKYLEKFLSETGLGIETLNSAMGRHAARAIEAKIVAGKLTEWIEMLTPGKSVFEDYKICQSGRGMGLTEAPRGALGHWISVENHKIDTYQCVVPTTWNCSPRDDRGTPGAVEASLVGAPVPDEKNPITVARIVRSFDPCIACAVH